MRSPSGFSAVLPRRQLICNRPFNDCARGWRRHETIIWLHDRDHYDGDLLIVRVDREGYILPPLVVFHSSRWKRRDFREVLKEEQARIPDNVLTEFRVQEDRTSYVENCVLQGPKYFREPQTQFCAIVPLDRRAYERQRGLDSMEETPFASFERRLGLPRLVRDAGKANDQWCECEAPYNEYSPSMIQCDNLKCPMGWYHKKCVDLDEDFTADRWLCDQCLRNWKSNEMSYFEDKKISEKIREAILLVFGGYFGGLGYLFYFLALISTDASPVVAVAQWMIIFVILLSYLFISTPITLLKLLGSLLIIGGSYLIVYY